MFLATLVIVYVWRQQLLSLSFFIYPEIIIETDSKSEIQESNPQNQNHELQRRVAGVSNKQQSPETHAAAIK